MWRKLLARLHPDAGGDPELFLFACYIKDQVPDTQRPANQSAHRGRESEAFLNSWQATMDSWATSNRDGLKVPRSSDPFKR